MKFGISTIHLEATLNFYLLFGFLIYSNTNVAFLRESEVGMTLAPR